MQNRRYDSDIHMQPPNWDIAPPTTLSPAALEIWEQLAPIAIHLGTLTCADSYEFGALCDAIARMEEARMHLNTSGAVIEGARGGELVKSPYLVVYRQSQADAHKLAASFGLNPAYRKSRGQRDPNDVDAMRFFS